MIGPAEIDDMLVEYAEQARRELGAAKPMGSPPVVEQAPAARSRYVTAGSTFWSECFGWARAPDDSVLG